MILIISPKILFGFKIKLIINNFFSFCFKRLTEYATKSIQLTNKVTELKKVFICIIYYLLMIVLFSLNFFLISNTQNTFLYVFN